jgi:DNA invertase Pin-like site-specific DNA recombinase
MSTKLTELTVSGMSTQSMSTASAPRAVTYSRYSSDMQRESSIEDQERLCRRRADAEGWAVETRYADAAITGSDNRRPQFLAMQQGAARKEFDVLLVDDLSRFARDSVDQETTIRRLEFQGIRIISLCGYDSESEAREMVRGFKGLQNQQFLKDLSKKVWRGQEGQALKARWCGGRPYGYKMHAITDPALHDAYGNPKRIGTVLEINEKQAPIVRGIFERFIAGDSCMTIAQDLNARGVPSPGSSWNRKKRRCDGWMDSAVYVIVRNPLYTGLQSWNKTKGVKDPDTRKTLTRRLPKSEWRQNQIEAIRIISDEQFARAEQRTKSISDPDERLKSGGKAKYVLTGLLTCAVCKAHYVLGDKVKYACSSFLKGRACSNRTRVNRNSIEKSILDPIRKDLRDPARVKRMAAEMERGFAAQIERAESRAATAPAELQELEARLDRLKGRLKAGDPDMTADELQGLVERVQAKVAALKEAQPPERERARVLALLPKAAAAYLKQVDAFAAGDPVATQKVRAMLQVMIGPITLSPGEGGSLWATHRQMDGAALVRTAGTYGRGEALHAVPAVPVRVCVKAAKGTK